MSAWAGARAVGLCLQLTETHLIEGLIAAASGTGRGGVTVSWVPGDTCSHCDTHPAASLLGAGLAGAVLGPVTHAAVPLAALAQVYLYDRKMLFRAKAFPKIP